MTREAYQPERLDSLALRLFDIAAQVRTLSQSARSVDLEQVVLHDRKALEWIEKLEKWMITVETDFERQLKLAAGARRAKQYRRIEP